jgi:hypothetical protein
MIVDGKGDPFDWTRPPRINNYHPHGDLSDRSFSLSLNPYGTSLGPEKRAEFAESPQFCLIDKTTNARTSFVNGHESSVAPGTTLRTPTPLVDQMLRPEILKPRRLL